MFNSYNDAMNDLNELTKEILNVFPTEQVRIDAMAHRRTKIHGLLLKHTASITETYQEKINELEAKVYHAEKALSEYHFQFAGEHDVDPAGFNK